MVKADDSWLFPPHPTWQSPNFNCMSTSVEPSRLGCLPARMNPGTCMVSAMTMPGLAFQAIGNSKASEANEAQGLLPQCSPPNLQNSHANTSPYLKENLPVFPLGVDRDAAPNSVPGLRRFVVFDRSENETRLIYSSLYPIVQKPSLAAIKPFQGRYSHHEDYAAKLDQIKPKLDEEINENQLGGEESEMHEDTEEINALLYSDDDDYSDDDEDDEVTSTGHSPILVKESSDMQEQVEEITDEVASSCGPNKRQKVLDGGYKKAPVVDTVSAIKVEGHHGYGDDTKSSYAIGKTQEVEMASTWGNKQFKKDKIRATLKILESIIPSAKGKDPLLVLDVAIDYLKSLKLKAKTVGGNYQ